VSNPSRGETIAEVPMSGADVVNEAVEAAAAAFPEWRDTPPVERARLFFR
jgi:malonate-semialdehyde dehydrogenase (acetylating) / methylmalonate-semialdehyde dehydrogenase